MASEKHITLKSGHKLWTKTVGAGKGTPLLLLHGGPGAGHDYLEPLEGLGDERPVVFYDQLGCGRSDKPTSRLLWTIERFADEIDEVRHALGLDTVHMLGQSWGGWLGVEYLTRQPAGLKSFVLASTSASIPQFRSECARLIAELPPAMQTALAEHGARGELDHPEYAAAAMEFYKRHLCRLPEWPDCVMRSIANLDGNAVYETINGPNEFTVIGNLRYWDRIDRLPEIKVPILITCGRYDELGPNCAATLQAGLPNARTVIFENSAHTPHVEEVNAYLKTVRAFLTEVDTPA
ncbi:MAG: proline iminopeptidase-family hydrolase [Hyphomicrobiaceae bacterium]